MGKEKKRGLGGFVAGAAIGAGVALLFAPQSGKETRTQLKVKFDDLSKKAKNLKKEDVQKAIDKKMKDIQKQLSDLDKEKVLDLAKKKGKEIKKKADELVDLAVKKGTPVVQKAAEDVRVKTIEVLEDTIKKLEKKDVPATKTQKKSSK